jgi:hypothetical protein
LLLATDFGGKDRLACGSREEQFRGVTESMGLDKRETYNRGYVYLPETTMERPHGTGQHGVGDVICYRNYGSVLKRH